MPDDAQGQFDVSQAFAELDAGEFKIFRNFPITALFE
jgi:hypothetical protein